MTNKILITGPPRCGKSTLISMLIDYYKGKRTIHGFLTPEIRANNQRIGFDVEDIRTNQKIELAREDKSYKGRFKVGKYRVFTKKFEEYVENSLNIELKPSDLLIIDEIGKMELYSKAFQDYIRDIFNLDINVITTIGEKLLHPIKEQILKIPEVKLYNLTRANQKEIFQTIISTL